MQKKMSKCCAKSSCRDSPSKLLESLAKTWSRSESSSDPKRGLYTSLSGPTETRKTSHSQKLLCQSSQEQLPVRGIAATHRPKCSRKGKEPHVAGFLQQTVSSPKTEQQMETHPRPKQTESVSKGTKIQNGNTGNHQNLPARGRMGYLHRLQGRVFPYSDTGTLQEISRKISRGRPNLPIQSSAVRSLHSSHGVHCCCQRSETYGLTEGYKNHQYLDDWLVRAKSHRACLRDTQTLVVLCRKLGWVVNTEKSELERKQTFDYGHRTRGNISKKN